MITDINGGEASGGAHTRPIGILDMDKENGPFQGHGGRAVGK